MTPREDAVHRIISCSKSINKTIRTQDDFEQCQLIVGLLIEMKLETYSLMFQQNEMSKTCEHLIAVKGALSKITLKEIKNDI